ncbi:MAG: HD domain-containing protein [Desulfotalea sp.]
MDFIKDTTTKHLSFSLFCAKITFFCCLFLLLTGMHSSALANDYSTIKNKNVLILHSYSLDYAWTENVHKGIVSGLKSLDWTNTVRVEFLDTKNEHSPDYISSLVTFLRKKHEDQIFDVVIATDNNALDFLNNYRSEITQETPLVVTGVNGTNSSSSPKDGIAIIAEKANHLETLNIALKLRPNAKNGYILIDASPTGEAIKIEVLNTITQLNSKIDFHFIDDATLEEMVHFAATRNPDDFIYLLPYFKDGSNKTFAQGQVATTLTKVSSVPIFCSWKFQLASGTTGGAITSGEKLGKEAAEVALMVLQEGKLPPLYTPTGQSLNYMFNFPVLKQFKLDHTLLPDNSILLGKPVSFFTKHKQVLIPGTGLILLLTITLLLSLKNLSKQKIIISLNTEVIETQRELVATLGEVIETRSKETGRHVKRVALYSRLIGEKAGLGARDVEILEAASPLHDIGKIGISERILNYPGKLNQEDFRKIQEHTNIGHDILKRSNKNLLKSACSIAYQHHERWDGNGYPQGLSGENIDIFARITMLADIFDALTMKRCYKPAWPEEKVLKFITQERGQYFDPRLVDIFFENYESIKKIRSLYPPNEECQPASKIQQSQ